tara:strand:+ start:748 stop:939 length:192 start_codon:yes stop_codon:yes gene_type:complete
MSKVPGQAWDGRVKELTPTSGEIAQIDVYVWRLDVFDSHTKDQLQKINYKRWPDDSYEIVGFI